MSKTVKNMIDAIKQGNYSVAQSEFKSAIAQKVSTTFENKKIEIASRMTEGRDVPSKHQEKIAKDTLKNPDKALLGGPSVKEAEKILKNKFGYTDDQIKKLKESNNEGKKITESSSLPSRLVDQYERRADAERRAGGSIEIDYRLPYIAIEMSDGSEYFFQEREADNLLDTVPDNINAEDFLLATAQNW